MNQAAAEFQQLTGHPPGGYAILAGNEPPRPLDAAPPGRTALYDGLGLEPPTRTVAEYAFQLPRELVGNLTRKAVYAVGLFELSGIDAVGADVPDASWVYVALWCAALAGAVRLLRAPVGFTWPVVLLPALLALSHFAAVVLIMGHWYGDRLILPLYPLLVPYAALGLEPLVHWAQSRVERVTIAVLVALALCVFVTVSSRVSDVVILLVFGGVVLAFTTGPRPRVTLRAWLYYGYTAALIVAFAETRFIGSGGVFDVRASGGDFDLAVALLLPLAVFAVARLARARVPYVATLGAVVLGAVIATAILRPPLPGVLDWGDVLDGLRVIGRDIQAIGATDPEAPRQLAGDVRETLRVMFQPMFATFQSVTTQVGAVAGVFLLGIWGRALLVSGRAAVRERSAAATLCFAALVSTCVLGVLGVAPAGWGASSYSVAVLAVLFGLAESLGRSSTNAAANLPETFIA